MKHVFTVHSPITFLAAHAVIEHLNLPVDDVVILSNRYKVPINYYNVFPFYSNLKSSWMDKLKKLNVPLAEDKYINDILHNQEFTAYVDLMSYHQVSLVTNPNCKQFHFIEEGNSSYRKGDDFETLTWNWFFKKYPLRIAGFKNRLFNIFDAIKWSARGYNLRFLSIPYSFTSYAFVKDVKFFCFSDAAYPDLNAVQKVVTPLSPDTKYLKTLAAGIALRDTCIWIDGSNRSFTGLPDEAYHYAIDRAIQKFKEPLQAKGVSLKLRPGLKDYSMNYLYQQLVKNDINVNVLPDNLIIEAVLVNSQACTVIGNLSSVLFYAGIFGHKPYSIYHLYKKRVKTIFDDMPGYWAVVKDL